MGSKTKRGFWVSALLNSWVIGVNVGVVSHLCDVSFSSLNSVVR